MFNSIAVLQTIPRIVSPVRKKTPPALPFCILDSSVGVCSSWESFVCQVMWLFTACPWWLLRLKWFLAFVFYWASSYHESHPVSRFSSGLINFQYRNIALHIFRYVYFISYVRCLIFLFFNDILKVILYDCMFCTCFLIFYILAFHLKTFILKGHKKIFYRIS